MPLRIELAPFERMVIGDTCIRNGERRSRLVIETEERIIRGRNLLLASEADTPCKRLYLVLEYMYLDKDPRRLEQEFVALANDIMKASPSSAPFISNIYERLSAGRYYQAMAAGRELLSYERTLLARIENPGLEPADPVHAAESGAEGRDRMHGG